MSHPKLEVLARLAAVEAASLGQTSAARELLKAAEELEVGAKNAHSNFLKAMEAFRKLESRGQYYDPETDNWV